MLVTTLAIKVLKRETGMVIYSHGFSSAISSVVQTRANLFEFAVLVEGKTLYLLRLSLMTGCESLSVFRNVACFAPVVELGDWGIVQSDNVLTIVKEEAKVSVAAGVKQIYFALESRAFLVYAEHLAVVDWKISE